MTLYRRIPRQLAHHAFRYLSLVLLIAVGSVLLLTLNIVKDSLEEGFDRLMVQGQAADARVWLVNQPGNLESLGQHHHIAIEARTALDIDWRPEVSLRLFDLGEAVDRPFILQGRLPQNDHEILLTPAFAKGQNIAIGDTLALPYASYRICGFFTLPDYIYPTRHESDLMADPGHFGIAIISKKAMAALLDTVNLTDEDITVDKSYGIRYLPGHGDIKQLLKDRFGLLRWLERADNIRINMVKSEITGIREMNAIIPVVFFLINSALLAAILWRMIRLEFRTIGTLRALGLTRGEILRHYLALPLLTALTGTGTGAAISLSLARPVLEYYAIFYNLPVDRLEIDWNLMRLSILLPVTLLTVTALIVILRAVHLKPLALMRGYRRRVKAMSLERMLHMRLLPFELKFRIRQTVRSLGKLFAVVIGVSFSSMLILSGFLAQESFTYLMDEAIRDTLRYSDNYVFKVPRTDNPFGGEPYQIRSAIETKSRESLVILGLSDHQTLLNLKDASGQPIDLHSDSHTRFGTGDKIYSGVVSRVLVDRLGVQTGQTLSFVDLTNNQVYYIEVSAIAETYTQLAVYLPLDPFNKLFGLPLNSFTGLFSASPLAIDAEDLYLHEQTSDVINSFKTYAGMMQGMLLGMGLTSSIMAFLILYVLIALLIEENSRSISLMKILGYDPREIRRLILRTFNLPVLVGFASGIPLLLNFYGTMLESSFEEIDMTMPLRLSPRYLGYGFVLLYATYLLTRWLSGRKILKISMADGLKSMQE